jgi:nucleoside-diphosphate-sugar epimerase
MKVVYVTGCLGFIGSYVTRACLEKGWYVRGIDKCTYASNKDLLSEFTEKYPDKFSFEKIHLGAKYEDIESVCNALGYEFKITINDK